MSVALAEAATLSRGKQPWATVGEVAKLQQLSIYLCHPESGSDPLAASASVDQATLGAPEFSSRSLARPSRARVTTN